MSLTEPEKETDVQGRRQVISLKIIFLRLIQAPPARAFEGFQILGKAKLTYLITFQRQIHI
jgi:hypothetical protein